MMMGMLSIQVRNKFYSTCWMIFGMEEIGNNQYL